MPPAPKPLFPSSVPAQPSAPKPRVLFDAMVQTPFAPVSVPAKPAALFGGQEAGVHVPARGGEKPAPRPMFADSVIRRRIEVPLSALEGYKASPQAIREAHYQIVSLRLEDVNHAYVLDWGAGPQDAHQSVLTKLLSYATDSLSQAGKQGVLDIIQLIESIDLTSFSKTGFFASSKESKMRRINEVTAQIRAKVDDVSKTVPTLKARLKELAQIAVELDSIDEKLAPWVISCDFFANYQAKQPDFPSALFIARLTSLLSTKSTIEANRMQRAALEQSALGLIDLIQGTVRTEIPLWQSTYLSCLTGGANTASVVADQGNLINKLRQATV